MNNPFDEAYHGLLGKIIDEGFDTGDRTGTGTRKLFGEQLKFDLREGFPLLTTKKLFTKGIVHELLWIISGSTNIEYLLDNDVHIWDEWTPVYKDEGKEGLKKFYLEAKDSGQPNPGLDLGPVYGKQWRNFGEGKIVVNDEDFDVPGFDQLAWVINRIKTNPTCRRQIVTAWNPNDVKYSALPPCHCFFHFNVFGDRLDLMMYQRSCDVFLGVPFNIASYALLLEMVAKVTGLKAGIFTHNLGDVHIYNNHFDQVKEQLSRTPYSPPTLQLTDLDSIDEFIYDDIKIVDYKSHDAIKAEVSV